MATKSRSYVDTSAFIAFLDHSDTHHALFARLFSAPPRLVTTSLVVNEGHAWFLKRYNTHRALQFISFIEDLKPLEIVSVGQKELQDGIALLRRFSDQTLTLADAVGLSIMKKLAIKTCWSTDKHLSLTGVPLIIY